MVLPSFNQVTYGFGWPLAAQSIVTVPPSPIAFVFLGVETNFGDFGVLASPVLFEGNFRFKDK